MSIFEITYWAAIIVEMVIRAPLNKKRKQEKMSEQRVSPQEKFILFLLLIGMMILPLIYSASSWLDFAN